MRCAPSPGVGSGAALGISGPYDRRGLKPRHLESARATGQHPVKNRSRLNEC